MLSRQQQRKPHGDNRQQVNRARQAAEALFAAKPPPVSTPATPEALTPTIRSTRKPRVLPIVSRAAPVRYKERETPAAPERQTMRAIPGSEFGRIRTLVKYGMTVTEVATVYGVAADGIARILRRV
ncbi:MAG: hypothetical protein WB611_03440 [Stellaceae bacterium]